MGESGRFSFSTAIEGIPARTAQPRLLRIESLEARQLMTAQAVGTAASLAVAQTWPYLEDADTTVLPAPPIGAPPVVDQLWPRINMTEGAVSDIEVASKYHTVSYSGSRIAYAAALKEAYPKTTVLRLFLPRSYQSVDSAEGAGLPFERTGPSTANGAVFAGHWQYLAGSKTTQSISAGATQVTVADPSRFKAGQYVVIYDGAPGSFNNAEHVLVTAVNASQKKLTLANRGFKSNAVAHSSGAIIAQHELGSGGNGEAVPNQNWAFNQSSAAPADASGRKLNVVMANWLAQNLNEDVFGHGIGNFKFDGVLFDGESGFFLTNSALDVNNDLVPDGGISPTGVNWHGQGFDTFYDTVRAQVGNNVLLVAGNGNMRSFDSLSGAQHEGYPHVNTAYTSPPKYNRFDEKLNSYTYHVLHSDGPSYSEVLSKSPTKLYPTLENGGTRPTTNAPFRLSFGFALLENGSYGQKRSEPDAWWDEYAVDVRPGSSTYGKAIADNPRDEAAIRANRSWLGEPLGPRQRIYDPAVFAPSQSLVSNGLFETNLTGWTATNVTMSLDRTLRNVLTGTGAIHAGPLVKYKADVAGAVLSGPAVNLAANTTYTIAFAARSSVFREIGVQFGKIAQQQSALVSTEWTRYVMTFDNATAGTFKPSFLLGRESSDVWIDDVYVFKGSANVFRRDYENGVVIVNGTSKSQTVDTGGGLQRINGSQDPINNGALIGGAITIPAFDAAILVRRPGARVAAASGSPSATLATQAAAQTIPAIATPQTNVAVRDLAVQLFVSEADGAPAAVTAGSVQIVSLAESRVVGRRVRQAAVPAAIE